MRASRRSFLGTLGGSALGSVWPRGARGQPTPLTAYPLVAEKLRHEADRRSRAFAPSGLTLVPRDGALAPALDVPEIAIARADGQPLAPDSLLTFAIDVARRPMYRRADHRATDDSSGLRSRCSATTR